MPLLNYASTANIEEVKKFYNLGHKTFETDFKYFDTLIKVLQFKEIMSFIVNQPLHCFE